MPSAEGESQAAAGREDGADPPPKVPCRLFLPVVPAARVIGKGGASIKAIREQSGAGVRILQKELPQEMQRREDRVVVLTGTGEQVQEAISGVLERVFDRSGLPEGAASSRAKERLHLVEVLVPDKSGSHLIGQRGERIKVLIEETRCDLHVAKEPMAGLFEQKRVRVAGSSVEEAAAAVWKLQEVLIELVSGGVLRAEHFELREAHSSVGAGLGGGAGLFGSVGSSGAGGLLSSFGAGGGSAPRPVPGAGSREVPVRLLVSKAEAAWVVGKKGNKITRLRDLAKVQMGDADAPPFDASERVLEITNAALEQRLRVVQIILSDLAQRQGPGGDLRLLVPTELFGSVMGHRGETIRGIMQSTGAKLQQHKAERTEDGSEYRFRLIEVRGDKGQRVEAVRQVYLALERRSGAGRGPQLSTPMASELDAGLGLDLNLGSLGFGASLGSFGPTGGQDGQAGDVGVGVGAQIFASSRSAVGGFGVTSGGGFAGLSGPGGAADFSMDAVLGLDGGGHSMDAALGLDSPDGQNGRKMSLQLAMPNEEAARTLANDSSGIAWRAGVELSAGRGAGGVPILQVAGTAVGNSVACYLIQDRLFMMH